MITQDDKPLNNAPHANQEPHRQPTRRNYRMKSCIHGPKNGKLSKYGPLWFDNTKKTIQTKRKYMCTKEHSKSKLSPWLGVDVGHLTMAHAPTPRHPLAQLKHTKAATRHRPRCFCFFFYTEENEPNKMKKNNAKPQIQSIQL